jgi:hypothetical protein
MTKTEADENRAVGIWPARPMTPFEPLPTPRPLRRTPRRILEIAGRVIGLLVLLSGVAYALATATGHIA